MRLTFTFALLVSVFLLKAQTFIPAGLYNNSYGVPSADHVYGADSSSHKKWSLTRYSGVSTSFAFFKGGNSTILSVPVGLQLNRRLNNNLYAFAGVSVAPAYVNFSRSFMSGDYKADQQHALFQPGNFGLYSKAVLGLQYTNDEKTFSISGSIGVGRTSYPILQYDQMSNSRITPVFSPNR